MRIVLIILFLGLVSYQSQATNYYIRNGGSDAALGTSEATAWATINKLNTVVVSLAGGDTVKFMVNEIHYGRINTAGNGSTGNPVVFCSYGGAGKATLSGFAVLNSWSLVGSNIWQAVVNSGTYMDVFVLSNQLLPMGRTPDTGSYFNIDSYQNSTGGDFGIGYTGQTITSTGMPSGTQNWVGARLVIRKNAYNIDPDPITSHSGNVVGYSTFNGNPVSYVGNKVFVQHHVATLNQPNEWFYDAAAGVIKMYSTTDPSSFGIKVGKEDFAYRVNDLSGGNSHDVTFRNLIFEGYDSVALCFTGMDNMTIKNCEFYYIGAEAVAATGSNVYGDRPCNNLIIDSCKAINIGNTGFVSQFTTGTRMRIDTTNYCGVIEGMGKAKNQQRNGIMIEQAGTGDSVVVYGNTILNSGYCGIRWTGRLAKISYNYVNTFGVKASDGGGIYTSRESGDSSSTYRSVDHNVIINGIGDNSTMASGHNSPGGQPGIYNDDKTVNVLIAYNTIMSGSRYQIFLHNNRNITVQYNNIHADKDDGAIGSAYDGLEPGYTTRGLLIQYNNIFATTPKILDFYSYLGTDVASYGTINNNYYSRTSATNMFRAQQVSTVSNYSSVSAWNAGFGFDAASSYITVNSDSASLKFNGSAKDSIVYFPGETFRDLQGNNYTNSVTLAPSESKVLRKVTYIAPPVEPDRMFRIRTRKRMINVKIN